MFFTIFLLLTFLQEGRLTVSSTADPTVFEIKYTADLKWNVEVTLLNSKGKKKFSKTIKNTDGFLLPINLDGEDSGDYLVEIFTPAYNLSESVKYLSWQDRLRESLSITYDKINNLVRVDSKVQIPTGASVYIYNEKGIKLIDDSFKANSRIVRSYNLSGAPANTLEVIVSSLNSVIANEKFDF